jgi:predicted nucleic acid-binding protein
VTVVDASSLTAFVLREEGWERVEEVLRESPESVELLPVETTNAVLSARRQKRLDPSEALGALRTVRDLTEHALSLTPHGPLVEASWQIASEEDLTVYDAIYLALARQRRRALASRDLAQLRAARHLGIRVVDA